MNNLKDIHNIRARRSSIHALFYQDFNEQFEGYTQLVITGMFSTHVVLSGFQ